MNFRLRHMPRRGSERVRFGTFFGPSIGSGITRLVLKPDLENKKKFGTLPELGAHSIKIRKEFKIK